MNIFYIFKKENIFLRKVNRIKRDRLIVTKDKDNIKLIFIDDQGFKQIFKVFIKPNTDYDYIYNELITEYPKWFNIKTT